MAFPTSRVKPPVTFPALGDRVQQEQYGAGTVTSQLMGWRFHRAAGIEVLYVPFKGTPATVNGLLTKSVDMIYAANVIVNPLVASQPVHVAGIRDGKPAAWVFVNAGACPG